MCNFSLNLSFVFLKSQSMYDLLQSWSQSKRATEGLLVGPGEAGEAGAPPVSRSARE